MSYNKNYINEVLTKTDEPGIDYQSIKYYLTLSIIFERNSKSLKIFELQQNMLKNIEYSDICQKGIYKYQKDRVHFSLINFADLAEENIEQSDFVEKRREQIQIIKNIIGKINNEMGKLSNNQKKIDFGFIWNKKKLESFAIQAFPSSKLLEYFNRIKEYFYDSGLGVVEIKGLPKDKPERFATNLIRFFRQISGVEFIKLSDRIEKINFKSSKKPLFSINLKEITFVVSNNWLSNNKYDQNKPIKL